MHTLSLYKGRGYTRIWNIISKTINTPFVFEAFFKSEAQVAPNFIVAVTRIFTRSSELTGKFSFESFENCGIYTSVSDVQQPMFRVFRLCNITGRAFYLRLKFEMLPLAFHA